MDRLIAYVDKDPDGLTPHYQAHAIVGGDRFEGGWWRTPEKAVAKLVAALAPWPANRVHAACEVETACVYPTMDDATTADHAAIRDTLDAAGHTRWPHGGGIGVTDDGRIWYGPSTFGSSEWDRMNSDMRAVRRAEALVHNATHGHTRRAGWIANLDVEILQGLLRLAAAAYDPNAIRRATLIAAIDNAQTILDKEPRTHTDVRYGLALAIAALGNQLAALNESPVPIVQGSDADEPLPETLPEATNDPRVVPERVEK